MLHPKLLLPWDNGDDTGHMLSRCPVLLPLGHKYLECLEGIRKSRAYTWVGTGETEDTEAKGAKMHTYSNNIALVWQFWHLLGWVGP